MAGQWRGQLKYDPIPVMLAAKSEGLRYFVQGELLDESGKPVESLWESPEVGKILRNQLEDGAWAYPGGGKEALRSSEDYNQIETFRRLGWLVEMYGLDHRYPAIQRAADFMFSRQAPEGDFRGILGNQYAPYYSAAFMELLIKAGYGGDPRIERGFHWLISMRQQDGGWAIPMRTHRIRLSPQSFQATTLQPDRSKPFSHLITGVVLRAFAAHPDYRSSPEARHAGELLAGRFFKRDAYPDRSAVSYWISFSFPFWFTDLLSALDSLSKMGFDPREAQIKAALDWFIDRQQPDGGWELYMLRSGKEKDLALWYNLVICRVLKRFYG